MDEIIDREIINFNHDPFTRMKFILSEIQKMRNEEYIKYDELKENNKKYYNDVLCDLLSSLLEEYHNNSNKLFYKMKIFINEQLNIFNIEKINNCISYYENLNNKIIDDMQKLYASSFIHFNFVLKIYISQKQDYYNLISRCIFSFFIMLKHFQSEDFINNYF